MTARPIPPRSAPFPTGTTTAAGVLAELVEELVADRRVALVLRGLGAVLEERHAAPRRLGLPELLGLVHVGALAPDLGAEALDVGELRRARLFGDEDDGARARAAAAAHAVAAPWLPVDAVTTVPTSP